MSQSVTSKNSSRGGSERSSRTNFGNASTAGAPTKGKLRKAEMEFDRRQIRLKLAEKLEVIGQTEDSQVLFKEAFEDEVFDEDPGEDFPWKQREVVVAAVARGGVSEDRSEGFDSMELALKAQATTTSGGAIQNLATARNFYQPRTMTRSAKALADWALYNQVSQHSLSSNSNTTSTSDQFNRSNNQFHLNKSSATASFTSHNSSKKLGFGDNYESSSSRSIEQQDTSTPQLFKCLYLLLAISAIIGFVYFTVYFKLGYYQSATPAGNYQVKGNNGLGTSSVGGLLPKSNNG